MCRNRAPRCRSRRKSEGSFALLASKSAPLGYSHPDLGVEWRLNRHVGILVNGSYTSWTWNSNDRRYALWEIAPEARYYIGKEKRGYIGAIYKAGSFNYKLSEIGKQGNLMGGGLTADTN